MVHGGGRRCEKHARTEARQLDARRGSAAQRGYGYKWQKAREVFLAEHPLCVRCQARGQLKPATDVDHIVPHRGDMSLFWRRSNWQSLCHSCHSAKTAIEDSRFARKGGAPQKFHTPSF